MSTNATAAPPATEVEAPEVEPVEQDAPKAPGKGKQTEPEGGKQKGAHPWTSSLEAALASEDPAEGINQMLLESQAHTTRTEQSLANYNRLFGGNEEVAQIASGIVMGLENDPLDTLVKVAIGISVDEDGKPAFDPEDFIVALEDHFFPDGLESETPESNSPEGEYDPEEPGDQQTDEYRQWVQGKMQEEDQAKNQELYQGIVSQIEQDVPGFDANRFHQLVRVAEGDLHAAFEDYMENWHQAPKEVQPAPPAPGGGIGPQEAKEYTGFDEAIADTMAELRAGRK